MQCTVDILAWMVTHKSSTLVITVLNGSGKDHPECLSRGQSPGRITSNFYGSGHPNVCPLLQTNTKVRLCMS